MPIETLDDIIEEIADSLDIYGCGPECDDHPDACKCRICFVISLDERIHNAMEIQKKLKEPEEYKTLEQQIIELWKERGLEVGRIEVDPLEDGTMRWCIIGKEE